MKNKKGFTLIETIISIVLISIVIVSLLEIISFNSKKSYENIKNLEDNIYYSLLLNIDSNFQKEKVTLYEILSSNYNIDNMEIIENLKNKEYNLYYEKDKEINLILINTSKPLYIKKIFINNNKTKKYFYQIKTGK